eukprot:scaffold2236_cov136-Isochrysis_galbana.AAC.2
MSRSRSSHTRWPPRSQTLLRQAHAADHALHSPCCSVTDVSVRGVAKDRCGWCGATRTSKLSGGQHALLGFVRFFPDYKFLVFYFLLQTSHAHALIFVPRPSPLPARPQHMTHASKNRHLARVLGDHAHTQQIT